jgi:4-hydroxy-3-methylbut-2-enyl diphosphate reductase
LQVIRAEAMGMCFGVRDALELAQAQRDPDRTTIQGELVHNEEILRRLRRRGFHMQPEARGRQLPKTPKVLVTAHGISDRERKQLEGAGHQLVDTTCPLVVHVHDTARDLQAAGYHVLVIGKPGHVEVRGIVGDLSHFHVVDDPAKVERYPYDRLGVVCQSTFMADRARAILAAIEARNPGAEVRFVDTICEPTKQRVRAVRELSRRVRVVVVVGGRNSNNTRQLAAMCTASGCSTHHVQGPGDLRLHWFRGVRVVGLTAGTSTLPETIDDVEAALNGMQTLHTPVRRVS